jgi:16S rRNA (adenine1518-N6/adenine1519-N6)-dimethyltransferase
VSRSQLELLRAHGIRPRKRRGQNFLVDGNLARRIADDVLALGDRVLELGAGAGALTRPLLDGGARVAAVENDERLCTLLRAELGKRPGFRLITADLARRQLQDLLSCFREDEGAGASNVPPVVAGNLPYQLTSRVLFGLADARQEIAGAVLMTQREVAQRLVASPGGGQYGLLAVVLGSVFAIDLLRRVPPDVFWPRPEVESAVVRFVPLGGWESAEYQDFLDMVKLLFQQRRKKLGRLLRSQLGVPADQVDEVSAKAGLDPRQRPEDQTREALRRLSAVLAGRRPS